MQKSDTYLGSWFRSYDYEDIAWIKIAFVLPVEEAFEFESPALTPWSGPVIHSKR